MSDRYVQVADTDENQMADDLRTRIAAIQQSHVFCITECSCGHRFSWEKSTEWRERAQWEWARHVADAVIRELGLEPETRIGPGEPGEGLSGYIRYVTGWRVDG